MVKIRSVAIEGREPWLLYGGRFRANVPVRAEVVATPDDVDPLDFRVTLTIDIVDGRLACTELLVDRPNPARPVTGEDLRRVPVAAYVAQAARDLGIIAEKAGQTTRRYEPPPVDFAKNGMTDQALDDISRIYAAAQTMGQKSSGILLTEYGMPRPTTARWLAAARRRGVLVEDHFRLWSHSPPIEGTSTDRLTREDNHG